MSDAGVPGPGGVAAGTPGTVIFDFDGTLFRLPVDWIEVRARLGLAPTDSLTEHLRAVSEAGNERRTGLVLGVLTEHERAAVRYGEFLPGALPLLRELSWTYRVAVLTRNSRHCVLDAFAASGVSGVHVVGREDVRRPKPDPEGVHAALAALGGSARRCVLVGDTFHDVQAANAAGVCSVVVKNAELAYPPAGAGHYVTALPGVRDVLGAVFSDVGEAGLR